MINFTNRKLFKRKIKNIEIMTIICRRSKIRRCRKSNSQIKQKKLNTSSNNSKNDLINNFQNIVKKKFSLICKKSQCIFCFDDERKFYEQRAFNYNSPSKMMNETNKHLKKFAFNDKISCSHSTCKSFALILSSIKDFKTHIAKIHRIFLRE